MKLVKKILRLLPLLLLIYCALYCIFSKNTNLLSLQVNEVLNLLQSIVLSYYEDIMAFSSNSFFAQLSNWFLNNFGESGFILFPIFVMYYELVLSLIFLCFDFINMIFGWANKFIKKGSDFE